MLMRIHRSYRLWWLFVVFLSVSGLTVVVSMELQRAAAQGAVPTPLPINIPTRTATPVPQITTTPSRTPLPGGNTAGEGRVEAKDKTTGANVRASPSTDAEILGKIYPGQFYAIIGRSVQWLKIQYDKVPSGVAWVYEGVVNITGISPSAIPTIDPSGVPTANLETNAAKQTADYLTRTPGAPGTATALQGSATGVFTRVAANLSGESGASTAEALPTFTFPPPMAEATLPGRKSSPISQGGLPPVVPIMVLGGVGMLGLLISALRRL
jgi:hypothetical protein